MSGTLTPKLSSKGEIKGGGECHHTDYHVLEGEDARHPSPTGCPARKDSCIELPQIHRLNNPYTFNQPPAGADSHPEAVLASDHARTSGAAIQEPLILRNPGIMG